MKHVKLNAVVYKGKIAFVAFSPELGVYSQGKTEKSALKNLQEAVELYLEDPDVKINSKKIAFLRPKLATIEVLA